MPSASVIVSPPLAYSPPAIPISTDLPFLAILTRTKVGSSFGNEPSVATSSATPLTEIDVAAAISGASGVEPPVVKPPSVAPSPSACSASFFVSTGVVSVPSFGSETRGGAVSAGSACCANGSLLAKRSKVASWPWTASGERSESATAESSGAAATGASPVAVPGAVVPGAGVTPGVVVAGAVDGRRGHRLWPLQHLQRLRALEREQREQEHGASDRDLLLLGLLGLQRIDALRHYPVASLPVASLPAGGGTSAPSVVVAGGVSAGGGTALGAVLNP